MISTHILDTTQGRPAATVKVRLELESNSTWSELATDLTNTDGRIVFAVPATAGIYRLTFFIEDYFAKAGVRHFFVNVPVVFRVTDTQRKYHVPLLLNPYGYSTYQGS